MKKIHFSVSNGEVVNPYSVLPPYYALTSKGIVKEIYMCFSVSNIAKHGQEWVQEQIAKELNVWVEYNPNLKMSLNKLVRQPKLWFKDTNHIEQSYDRFIFIRFY
jgi:hypothetical protein